MQKDEIKIARSIANSATPEQRKALLFWATELELIRSQKIPAVAKAKKAIKATRGKGVIAPIVKANLKNIKGLLWGNRSLPVRFAIIGITIGTLGFSGKAAGLAAFGRAVAVPIWLVLSAGGTLLGAIIHELQNIINTDEQTTTYTVIEAHEEPPINRGTTKK